MINHFSYAMLLAGAIAAVPSQAFAVEWQPFPMQAVVLLQNTSPVEVIETSAYRTDDKGEIFACAGFTNHSQVTATAIKLKFFQVDAFSDPKNDGDVTIDGQFSPDIPIKIKRAYSGMPNNGQDRCWSSVSYIRETRLILVRVEKVLFSDGSTWTSPLSGSSKPFRR